MHLLCWNINQRANYQQHNQIPPFVIEEILGKKEAPRADVIILTEYAKKELADAAALQLALQQHGYHYRVTNNQGNNILIALDQSYEIIDTFTWTSDYAKHLPDYLEVTCKKDDRYITIFGVRMLTSSYKGLAGLHKEMRQRAKQHDNLLQRIASIQAKHNYPLIGGGDFNTARKQSKNSYWNKQILADTLAPLGLSVVTPAGNSHMLHKPGHLQTAPDHLIIPESCQLVSATYETHFMDQDVYHAYKDRSGSITKPIPSPYPDHALIRASIKWSK